LSYERRTNGLVVTPHWRSFAVWYVLILLLGTGPLSNPEALLTPLQALVVVVIIALGVMVKMRTSRLEITAEMIKRTGGLLDRRELSWPTENLKEVFIAAGLTSRILRVGTIVLKPGDDSPQISFWGVEEPKKVKAEIEKLAGLSPNIS
jgi:uncharacterized membrane protein YdbT with pleckstrin-like domain